MLFPDQFIQMVNSFTNETRMAEFEANRRGSMQSKISLTRMRGVKTMEKQSL